MKDSLKFFYNGKLSDDLGLWNVSVDSGLFTESLLPSRSIQEVKVRGKEKPYFMSVEREPRSFSLSFAFWDAYDEAKIREIGRWLDVDDYQEFYMLDYPNQRFFCMPNGDVEIHHNGLNQGFITLTMRCNSIYSFSEEFLTEVYDFSVTTTPQTITLTNDGDVSIFPEIWITKVGDGDISIENQTTEKVFQLTGLINQEEVYVHNEYEDIQSDLPATYRYDNHNGYFLELIRGTNTLLITGNCTIQFRYRYKNIAGE